MSHIMSFDSFDDAMNFMADAEEAANDRATDEQKAIAYGDNWVRLYADAGQILAIFGEIPTPDELEADERRLGADDDEIAYERATLADSYKRGYRFGTAYSVLEPNGEMGSTHVSEMRTLTNEQFEEARRYGWDLYAMVQDDVRWAYDLVRRPRG